MKEKVQFNKLNTPKGNIDLALENNTTPPPALYKYCEYFTPDQAGWTKRVFVNNEIYFAAPIDFSDPFDSKIRYFYPDSEVEREALLTEWVHRMYPNYPHAILKHQVKGTVAAGIEIPEMDKACDELASYMQKQSGVFCMTEKKDNILMWAHYADQHTGFCLEFDTNNPLFSRARGVIYSKDLPKQNLVEFLTAKVRKPPLYLVTKAKDWKYEEEWRLADPASGPGPQEYPAESLAGVIFGCRMNEINRKQIKEWCGKREHPPKLYEAMEKTTEYGLDIVPISY